MAFTAEMLRRYNVQDTGLKLRYVLAAEANTYVASDNVTQFGYVTVVDAVNQTVRCPVIPLRNHLPMPLGVLPQCARPSCMALLPASCTPLGELGGVVPLRARKLKSIIGITTSCLPNVLDGKPAAPMLQNCTSLSERDDI